MTKDETLRRVDEGPKGDETLRRVDGVPKEDEPLRRAGGDVSGSEPLDPKVEAIRRKLVRLLAVSGAIMVMGFVAIVIAVVYRLNGGDDSAGTVTAGPVPLVLPQGARVTGTAVSDSRIALTLSLPDGRRVIRVHDTGGRLVVQYDLE